MPRPYSDSMFVGAGHARPGNCNRKGEALSAHWYAVHTRSNFENRVSSELAAKGVECYWPAVEEVHRWSDRRKTVRVPLFPGYVFARFADCPANRLRVLGSTGAVRILGCGTAIEPVPEHEIQSVRMLLDRHVALSGHPYLKQGDQVHIARGPLEGVKGVLLRTRSANRLIVSVHLLSQSVATEVNTADIEPIQ